MALKDAFIAELKHESGLTKKMLERVPFDKQDWKPHDKSMSLGKLATHVADIPHWISSIIHIDEFNFQKDYKPFNASTSEEMLVVYQNTLDKAIADLENMSDEDFKKSWTVKNGDQVMFSMPKIVAMRGWAFSHMIHHRGQLSVYLRLLDVPVPGMYGPTADEAF
jgi:uncharacterized damage-inducible protein DinB